jgi:hypothetical protein
MVSQDSGYKPIRLIAVDEIALIPVFMLLNRTIMIRTSEKDDIPVAWK